MQVLEPGEGTDADGLTEKAGEIESDAVEVEVVTVAA